MDELGCLLSDRLYNSRMRVTERVHAQACYEIEILLPVEIVEVYSFPFFKRDGITVVGRQKIALLKFGNLFEAGHTRIVKRIDARSRLSG